MQVKAKVGQAVFPYCPYCFTRKLATVIEVIDEKVGKYRVRCVACEREYEAIPKPYDVW